MFSPWTIAGFGLAVGLGLVLVFPQTSLLDRLTATAAADERPDQLNIEYLKVFLRARPQAQRLRGELVRQLIGIGEYAQARDQLAIMRASPDPGPRMEAAWFEYDILYKETYAQPERSPQRAQLAEALRRQLLALLEQPLAIDRLITLSQNALAAGDNATAKLIFARILQKDAAMGDGDAARLAAQSLGLGDYDSSAAFYFQAMEAVTNLDAKRDYYMQGLRTLLAGGHYEQMLAAADRYIGPLSNDKQTLLFLTRLAQSANRPAAAQRYVKQLLQLSMATVPGASFARFGGMQEFRATLASFQYDAGRPGDLRLVRTAASAATPSPAERPFDEEIYTLAFNVFLANSNLADARLLAQSAVRQRPDSAEWRKRLAQVSEWSGLTAEATPQWLAYARLSGDEAGWDNALRTSGGSFHQQVLTDVLEHKLQSNPGNVEWLNQLLDQYENIGEPRRAIALLKARMAAPPVRDRQQRMNEMQRLADLDLRVGDDDDALAVLRRMQSDFGPDAGIAVQIANRLYMRGKVDEAMAVLSAAAPTAPADNADFWRAYAELARFLQDDPAARAAYRKLLSSNSQNELDINNLINLISERQPMAAAALAEFGYRKNGARSFAIQALNFRNRAADWDGAQRFLDSLDREQTAQLAQNADFLTARAAVRQTRRDLPGAAADLRAALAMRPGDDSLRASLIWIMIAQRDTQALQRALRLWAADAETDAALWGPFAAANMSINRQPDALHWFRKSGFPRDDYLWLMSYAECLDATGQPDLAWRIRRRAWFDMRNPDTLRKMDAGQLRDMRDRLAALAPLFENGDDANRVLKALLRADVSRLPDPPREAVADAAAVDGASLLKAIDADNGADAAQRPRIADAAELYQPQLLTPGAVPGRRPRDDLRLSASVRELALAAALNQNDTDLARAWLATRFANQLDKPLWGELTLMLLADDRRHLNDLLDNVADWLPMYDRIDAARLAGRIPLAQTLAFDQSALLPDDAELHLRLVNLTTDQPPAFSASFVRRNEFPLETQKFTVVSGFSVTPGNTLYIGLADRLQRNTDTTQLNNVPGHDREADFTLRHRTDSGFIATSLTHRQAMENVNGARVEFSSAQTEKLTVGGTAGYRQPATESALMSVGAMRSGAEANANYLLSRTEYLRAGLGWQQYSTQAGTSLGYGRSWNIEAGTHLRVEYPNLTLRTFASGAGFGDKGASDAQIARLVPDGADPSAFRFMPVSTRVYGVSLGAGTVVENTYTRAWRPFAEFGMTYTPGIGWGRDMHAGIAGSVAGQDLLSVVAQSISATPNVPRKTLELGINYKWFY